MIKGIDISKWQGDINFGDVKSKNNIDFVVIKATEGNGLTDPKFLKNQLNARNSGLLCGYYHYARPDLNNTPEAEADYFLSALGELENGEFLALDYECTNQKQSDISWCKRFLDRVLAKTSVRPFVYLNQSQIKNFDWSEVVGGSYALWVASYTYDPNKNDFNIGEFPSAAMQQFSNKESIQGISGNVDGDVFFGNLDTLKKYGFKKVENSLPDDTKKALAILESYKISQNHGNLEGAMNDLIGKLKDLKTANEKIVELSQEIVRLTTEHGVESDLISVCQSNLATANKKDDVVEEKTDTVDPIVTREKALTIIQKIIGFIKNLSIK